MSESNIRFIKDNKEFIMAVRILVVVVAFLSCVIGTGQMEIICDTFMTTMGAVNTLWWPTSASSCSWPTRTGRNRTMQR